MTMQQITDSLLNIGPMTAFELHVHIGLRRLTTNQQIKLLRNSKSIHITRYDRQPEGVKGRCSPVYALGDLPDAEPLKRVSKKITNQRYTTRYAAVISTKRYSKKRNALGVWAGLI